MPPDSFWEQIPETYNAAMAGALKARSEAFQAQRDLALMTAYFSGQLSNWDWKKAPAWAAWHASMTQPPRRKTSAELLAGFRRLAANSNSASNAKDKTDGDDDRLAPDQAGA